jgi:Crp-like helix-turn-helix protein
LPFSQEIIADVLGLSVPHLNRVMQQPRADKLIESRLRLVNLVDVTGLRKLAHYHPFGLGSIPSPTTNA